MSTELRWLADSYEQSQRVRIETGERIRAVIQGRDQTFEVDEAVTTGTETEDELKTLAEKILDDILKGKTLGPVHILGRTYQRMYGQERDMYDEMDRAWRSHPVFPWLSRVRGIGPTLACKLLARFDIQKAQYASSFWKYAGLATEPGKLYRCAECGLEKSFPLDHKVTGKHQVGGAGKVCKGSLEFVTEDSVRVAQVHARKGEKATYDAYAKKILFLAAQSFLKCGEKSPYEQIYRQERAKLDQERSHWAEGRRHYTALRKVEKLFLAHLWQVWREAVGLPVATPYVVAHLNHDPGSIIDPWTMVEPEKVKKQKKSA